jgi:hypothetical protein
VAAVGAKSGAEEEAAGFAGGDREEGEEGVRAGEDGIEVGHPIDFVAKLGAVLGKGGDGGFLPGLFAGIEDEVPGEGGAAAVFFQAAGEVSGEAEFEAEGVEVGLELDDVEVAGGR